MADEKRDPRTLLADAIKRRDELNTFIKVLQEMIGAEANTAIVDAVLSGDPGTTGSAVLDDPSAVVYPGMFFGQSQPQAVERLLDKIYERTREPRPLKTRIIVECLKKGGMEIGGKKPMVNLWGILNRNPDTFILVKKAGWGLVKWYDSKVIEKMRREGADEQENGSND